MTFSVIATLESPIPVIQPYSCPNDSFGQADELLSRWENTEYTFQLTGFFNEQHVIFWLLDTKGV